VRLATHSDAAGHPPPSTEVARQRNTASIKNKPAIRKKRTRVLPPRTTASWYRLTNPSYAPIFTERPAVSIAA
jgi:hypothetical protein